MKKTYLLLMTALVMTASCSGPAPKQDESADVPEEMPEGAMVESEDDFEYLAEKFADLKIIRYRMDGFEQLTPDQKKLVYYLSQAALSGRDIIYDQNYKHNLSIRRTLEQIASNYAGERSGTDWESFMVYAKRVWFASGIHHHYGQTKILPEFSSEYFDQLISQSEGASWPTMEGESPEDFVARLKPIMFDPNIAPKKVNLDPKNDLVTSSANNFYEGVSQEEVEAYYASKMDKEDPTPISYGLNSKLTKQDGEVVEQVWKLDGMYGDAIAQIVMWLEKAVTVAENDAQKKALSLLVDYYRTGDLRTFDEYSVAWVADTSSVVDVINGFIEVYGDPLGYRATYESVVSFKDFDASARMQEVARNAQWFEDNSTIMDEHKKEKVTGVSYKVITVAMEAGDASPSTPIGINLPNANWIRANHGSKSVSLGNIIQAYDKAGGAKMLEEFAHDDEEMARAKEHGTLAGKMHTALHEVIGHASGKLNEGVGTPKETLKNYANALEEGRADLVALYYLMDPKLVELGLVPSLEVGMAEYDSYIRNGLMLQLRRLEPGEVIEEAHMRNRQMVAAWAYEKGQAENVIEKVSRDGKTYFNVNDYEKLRVIFGQLLREIQRIKSEGDYAAGQALIEDYGVQVDEVLHQEVLARTEKLDIAPYGGFINPRLVAVEEENGEIVDVKVEYPSDFMEQMMEYGKQYSFLPHYN